MKAVDLASVDLESKARDALDVSNDRDARIAIISASDDDWQSLSRTLDSIGFVSSYPVSPQDGMLPLIREAKPDVIALAPDFREARRDFISAMRADHALATTPLLAIIERDDNAISHAMLDDIDDVIAIPILANELLLRLRNLIRRNRVRQNSELNLAVNRERLRDRAIDLYDLSNDLLRCLDVT